MQFYLRVEGVNLDNFVYDVADLSTVRGGSLLLLDAVGKAEKILAKQKIKARAISKGASAGLFRFDAKDEVAAVQVRRTIEREIRESLPGLAHATFVVDVHKAGKDAQFRANAEAILALNRWRQVHAPNLSVPPEGDIEGQVCELDLVRPATEEKRIKGKVHWLSVATTERRSYGAEQKRRDFYARFLKTKELPPGFVDDLSDLSDEPSKGSLDRKIAVIYVDGNDFGGFRKQLTKPSDEDRWDRTLRGKREDLLKGLLKELRKKSKVSRESADWASRDWIFQKHKTPGRDPGAETLPETAPKLRFETLLWGGDELMWVVPGWQGWWTLEFFFRKARQWDYNSTLLKHAAGLVFCHHNAPIHRVKRLAENLCSLAKDAGKDENRVVYQILESFDHTGDDLEEFRIRRLPAGADKYALAVPADAMGGVSGAMGRFKAEFPKRKLHEIVRLWLEGKPEAAAQLAKETLDPLPSAAHALTSLQPCFAAGADPRQPERCSWLWLHLLDLWDYID